MSQDKSTSRRDFIRHTALTGAGVLLTASTPLLARQEQQRRRVASRGYAARDTSGHLSPWDFERRPIRDDDVLIEIKYSGICHSDIHQLRGDWAPQQYPQVPGHEIAGVVAAVGRNVTRFKAGDQAGVGTMVDSCGVCGSCTRGQEQHCERGATLFTYGYPDKTSPTGITQGGYANNIVVKERFAIRIPATMKLQDAACLLCAGITTYSPMIRHSVKRGDRVGIAGIGGLGHLAVKLAAAQGAEVYAFTTSPTKVRDIRAFGAKEVIVVASPETLKRYNGTLDYMVSTIPVAYDVGAYASLVKPYGTYTQVGMPAKGTVSINNFAFNTNRVNYNTSLVGGIPQTQQLVDFCAKHGIAPTIQIIKANEVNQAWEKVINKEARYRYVIDAATL